MWLHGAVLPKSEIFDGQDNIASDHILMRKNSCPLRAVSDDLSHKNWYIVRLFCALSVVGAVYAHDKYVSLTR